MSISSPQQQNFAAPPATDTSSIRMDSNVPKSNATRDANPKVNGSQTKSKPKPKVAKSSRPATPPVKALLNAGNHLPRIIGFTNQKGGVGKSTCSVHMVDWFIRQGIKALLIDADGQQCSSPWSSELGHPFEIVSDPDMLFDRLTELREDTRYDVIIVDGPGNASETTKTILDCVDLALIPIKESSFDITSTTAILRGLRQSQIKRGGKPKAALFFSIVSEKTLAFRDAREAIAQCQVPLLETAIYQRTCIIDSPGQCQTVFQVNRKETREAAARFEQLFLEALEVYNDG